MIRSHIMRLSMWSSEGVADLPILWIPQFSYHLTIKVVRSPKVRWVGDNLLIFWCSTGDILVHHIMGGSFFCFFLGDKILTAVFFSGERMMNQSKDQTLKMKDTAIRIHQHQAPFSTEQDGDFTRKIYVSKSECYDKYLLFPYLYSPCPP